MWVMCSWLLVGEKSRMTSLVAAEQNQNICLKLVWVIPNEQEVHRTYARHQMANFDCCAVMIVEQITKNDLILNSTPENRL